MHNMHVYNIHKTIDLLNDKRFIKVLIILDSGNSVCIINTALESNFVNAL
jgi:hypothetical protein